MTRLLAENFLIWAFYLAILSVVWFGVPAVLRWIRNEARVYRAVVRSRKRPKRAPGFVTPQGHRRLP